MASINEIFAEVLNNIVPTAHEIALIDKLTDNLKELIKRKAEELDIKYTKIEPQGSTGIKQTQVKNDFDIDLFIGLDYKEYESKYQGLSKNKLKKESKKEFLKLCTKWIIPSLSLEEFHNPRLLYAEHPYVTVSYRLEKVEIKIDIVLYFDLKLEVIKERGPITAVDRSPWHGRFIRDNLSVDQKNDARLLKQFFKVNHCYGDKSSVGKVGFIGYSAELLIYYFGNIQSLFENFKTLPSQPLDFYNRDPEILQEIVHFQNDYLIIVDPIDKNRNVGSAISERAYKYCNHRIEKFLNSPKKEFFEVLPIPEFNLSNLNEPLLSKTFIVELKNHKKEIHYTINRDKLHSIGESIVLNGEKEFSNTDRFGKIIFEVYFEENNDEYNIAFYCENPTLSPTFIRRGPPLSEKSHVKNFKKKNPNYFEKNGFLYVETKREFTSFLEFLFQSIITKIPDNFQVQNVSNSRNTISASGKKALTVLVNMVLPLYL
ncbi:MAG: hypothetical protein ACFFBI_05110 [Promethearchaeota archaeon]